MNITKSIIFLFGGSLYLFFLSLVFYVLTRSSVKITTKNTFSPFSLLGFMDKLMTGELKEKIRLYLKYSDVDSSVESFIMLHSVIIGINLFIMIIQMKGFSIFLMMKGFLVNVSVMLCAIHGFLFIRRKQVEHYMTKELSKITDLLYYQSKQDVKDDVLYFACSKMLQEPLKSYFEKLAISYKTKGDPLLILHQMKELSSASLLYSLIGVLENRAITGKSTQNLKNLQELMKVGKMSQYKMRRDKRRIQIIFSGVLLGGCITILLVAPLVFEMFRDLMVIFSS